MNSVFFVGVRIYILTASPNFAKQEENGWRSVWISERVCVKCVRMRMAVWGCDSWYAMGKWKNEKEKNEKVFDT